jgi:hypothetical protein
MGRRAIFFDLRVRRLSKADTLTFSLCQDKKLVSNLQKVCVPPVIDETSMKAQLSKFSARPRQKYAKVSNFRSEVGQKSDRSMMAS